MWGFDHVHPIRSIDIFAAPIGPRTLPHRPTSSTRAACHRLTSSRIGSARDKGLLRLPSCLAVSSDACQIYLAHLHIGAAVASLVTSRSLSASVTSSDLPLARGIVDAAMVLRSDSKSEHGTPTTSAPYKAAGRHPLRATLMAAHPPALAKVRSLCLLAATFANRLFCALNFIDCLVRPAA